MKDRALESDSPGLYPELVILKCERVSASLGQLVKNSEFGGSVGLGWGPTNVLPKSCQVMLICWPGDHVLRIVPLSKGVNVCGLQFLLHKKGMITCILPRAVEWSGLACGLRGVRRTWV